MPSLAAITLEDSVPEDIIFTPTDVKDGQAVWHARESGIAIGFPKLMMTVKYPQPAKPGQGSAASRVIRVPFKLSKPSLEVLGNSSSGITPPPTKAYELIFNGEFIFPERATLLERKDLIALVTSFLQAPTALTSLQNLESIY